MPKALPIVSVLALGNWGTALANYLAVRGHSVLGWSKDKQVVKNINSAQINPKFLSNVSLSKNLTATEDLKAALRADFIVLGFPSVSLADIGPKLKVQSGAILISAIKGFEDKTLKTPLQYIKEFVSKDVLLAVLSGPSFAKDIVNGNPAGVVVASASEEVASKVADLFSGGDMKIYTSTDPLGVEIGGAVKNVIALAAGVCDGLELGESARAGLITRGLAEMTRLGVAMGADPRTLSGLSGLGDLVMTATSNLSRNRTAGIKLARGDTLDKILKEIGSVVEGIHSTPLVLALAARHKVDMPITTQMDKVIRGEMTPKQAAKALLARPSKRES